MKFTRTRIAALGASAILILAGASVAFAEEPSAVGTIERSTAAPQAETAPEAQSAPESETAPETESAKEAESDGPGGHEDPEGEDVDHQFEGEE